MNLYELTQDLRAAIAEFADDETGKGADIIECVEAAFDDKAEAVALYIKNLEAEHEAVMAEAAKLTRRAVMLDKKAGKLREYLRECLTAAGKEKLSTARVVVAIRKNPQRIEVIDEHNIPSEFFNEPKTIPATIDRRALLEALKQGRQIIGARIEQSTRLVIE